MRNEDYFPKNHLNAKWRQIEKTNMWEVRLENTQLSEYQAAQNSEIIFKVKK